MCSSGEGAAGSRQSRKGGERTVRGYASKEPATTPAIPARWAPFVFFCTGPDAVAGVYLGAGGDGAGDRGSLRPTPSAATPRLDGSLHTSRHAPARRLDLRNRVLEGDPVVIANDVWYVALSTTEQSGFSAAHSGVMAYRSVIQLGGS